MEIMHETTKEELVDKEIYTLLKENEKMISLKNRILDANIISLELRKEVYNQIAKKQKMILSLFNGDFDENCKKVREDINTKKDRNDKCIKIANNILKRRINELLDSIVEDEEKFEISQNRKQLIIEILDENLEIDLSKKNLDNDLEL